MKKQRLSEMLKISHSAICLWEARNKIPAERCFDIAPILSKELNKKISPQELFENPKILFDLFRKKDQ